MIEICIFFHQKKDFSFSEIMAAVPVRVEPPGQNPVVEVGYDGQELTQPALTMTENLAKLARKVDFSQTGEEGGTSQR